jgi:hypothetical protein
MSVSLACALTAGAMPTTRTNGVLTFRAPCPLPPVTRLSVGCAGTRTTVAISSRPAPDPGRSLDYEDAALTLLRPLQVPPDLFELSIAFEQQAIILAHPNTLNQPKLR